MSKKICALIAFAVLVSICLPQALHAETQNVQIKRGWYLFALPLQPATAYTAESLGAAINAAGGACAHIRYWDGSGWVTHIIGQPFGDFSIETGRSYFIYSAAASTIAIDGTKIKTLTLHFYPGFNGFSVPVEGLNYTAEKLGQEIKKEGGNCDVIQYWDGSWWISHLIGKPFGNFNILPSQGLFLRSSVESTFVPGPSPPSNVTAVWQSGKVVLAWSANLEPDLAGYNIYRSLSSSGPYTKINSTLITAVNYYDSGLITGKTYYYTIRAVDGTANESTDSSLVSCKVQDGVMISGVIDGPDAFSPNGDGYCDMAFIGYSINKNAKVTIKLYDSSNRLVRILKENVQEAPGNLFAVWYGEDDSYNLSPDGTYTYRIDAVDSYGNRSPQAQGNITIDNNFMRIIEPVPGSALAGTVILKAVPSIYVHDVHDVGFYYCFQGNPDWVPLGSAAKQPDGSWTLSWDTRTAANGNCEILIFAWYFDLNNEEAAECTIPITYTVGNEFAIGISDSPDAFSPNGDAYCDTSTISYYMTKGANVTIKLYNSSNQLVRTLKQNIYEAIGNHAAAWDGKNGAGNILTDGVYTYKVDVIDSQGSSAPQFRSTITIDNHFMQVIEPTPDSIINGQVTLKAVCSNYIHDECNIYFFSSPGMSFIGSPVKQPDGSWTLLWDTRTKANGDCDVWLYAQYYDLNNHERYETTQPITYTITNGFAIGIAEVTPNAFSPNGDNNYDTCFIRYNITEDADVTIKLYDSSNQLVRTLMENAPTAKGCQTALWDGKDDAGNILPDGTYTCKIDAVNSQGNNAPRVQKDITIDNHFMRIVEPASGSILKGQVIIKAVPSTYISTDEFSTNFVCHSKESSEDIFMGFASKQPDGSWILLWDTKTVPNGEYEIIVCVWYIDLNNEERSEHTPPLDCVVNNDIAVSTISASPGVFSPNSDSKCDTYTISYIITKDANITIKLYDSSDQLIRTLKESAAESKGNQTAIWDGKGNINNIVPDGRYTYRIDADDGTGNTATVSGTVDVDNAPPQISITSPLSGATLSGIVTIEGLANDAHWKYPTVWDDAGAVLYYGQGANPTEWIRMYTCDIPLVLDSGGIIPSISKWDTTILPNGPYVLRWEVIDTADNVATVDVPVTVYNEGPDITDLTVTPNPFSPDGSGTWIDLTTGEVFNDPGPNRVLDDVAVISFTASTYGFFDIKIYDPGNNVVMQLAHSPLYPEPLTHKITLQWNGYGQRVCANGQYRLVVNAGSASKEKTVIIGIDRKPSIGNAGFIPNPFSPDSNGINDVATLYYYLSEISYVTVEIYNQQNVLLRTLVNRQLLAAGHHGHTWDGKDDQLADLPDGRYTVKISAQAETGNIGDPVYCTVSILFISNIKISADSINPYLGERTTITYNLERSAATLNIKIYNNSATVVRNLVTNQIRSGGIHSEEWDGTDDSHQIVCDGTYHFVIEESSGVPPIVVYDPQGTDGRDISRDIEFSASSFNPLLNQFCVLNYNLPQAAKIYIKVRIARYSGPAVKVIKYKEPVSRGPHETLWDGRDEAGNFVDLTDFTLAIWGYTLDENSVIVTGGKPVISNLSVTPIRFSPYANPYSLVVSQTNISFNLSKVADVAINIYNSKGDLARALTNNQSCVQGANSIIWDGKDDSGNLVVNDYYRIMVQANCDGNLSDVHTLHSEVCY